MKPVRSALGALLVLTTACNRDTPSTCEAYGAALSTCFSQAGLDHAPGQGYELACDRSALDYSSIRYFRCVTEVLEASDCDVSADPEALRHVSESLAECHPSAPADSAGR